VVGLRHARPIVTDQRRLRFSDIAGLYRSDLPLACEVWLEDIYRAPWISREAMKLAAYFVRYMGRPEASALTLREIENQCQLSADEVRKALVLMRNFGAVESFMIDRNDIRAGICLGHLQRLRVLEAKSRFSQLLALPITNPSWPWSSGDDTWVTPPPAAPAVDPTAGAVAVDLEPAPREPQVLVA
jgi:hypothetical protein